MQISVVNSKTNFSADPISYAKYLVRKPVKVIFSDIDGTILNNNHIVPKSTTDAIKRLEQDNVHVVLTTGRGYRSIDEMFEKFGMKPDYAVTESGAIIVDANKNKIHQDLLSLPFVKEIIKVAKELKQGNLFRLSFDGNSYVEGSPEAYRGSSIYVQGLKSFNEMLDKGFLPARAIFANFNSKSFAGIEPIKQILTELFGKDLSVFVSGHNYCEVTNKTVSKANGIETLRRTLGYDYADMVCIGDAENDLSMAQLLTQNGGISISMGNGVPSMKANSRFVTDDVDCDGFAKAADTILEINSRLK